MSLEKRRLGTTDMNLTTVGIGTFAMGGGNYPVQLGAPGRRAIHRDDPLRGRSRVNWLDTAPIYGLGHAEEVVGRALREIPAAERPYVFTKAGMVFEPSKPFQDPEFNLRPRVAASQLEELAAAPSGRVHRPLSAPLAGPDRDPDRGLLEPVRALHRRGEGPGHRRLQLQRGATRELRGDPSRGHAPASALPDPA